jgi:hypothetical protein
MELFYSFDMVRLKHAPPMKTLQCDYIKEAIVVCFHVGVILDYVQNMNTSITKRLIVD